MPITQRPIGGGPGPGGGLGPGGPGSSPISNPLAPLPESPLSGTSNVGAAVTGTALNGHPGISGDSNGKLLTGSTAIVSGDGVFGTGLNGVHGVSTLNNGVFGENTGGGFGVRGQSEGGYGVYGSSTKSDGVHGESAAAGFSAVAGIHSAGGHGIYGQSTGTGFAGAFAGNVQVTGDLSVTGKLTGDVTIENGLSVAGSITTVDVTLTGADCAEEFDLLNGEAIEHGSVVVFTENGELSTSSQPYNRRVAGVISGAGTFRPGIVLDRRISAIARAPIALAGKVYCKVDAKYAPIHVGDLLTTSATPGYAMKVVDPVQAFGAVIGKALAPQSDGMGLIPVLVILQ